MIYIVTYDLRSRRDRTSLFETLQSFGASSHFMASAWLISTNKPRTKVAAELLANLDPQDAIFICRLTESSVAYLPPQAATWIAMQRQAELEREEKYSSRTAA